MIENTQSLFRNEGIGLSISELDINQQDQLRLAEVILLGMGISTHNYGINNMKELGTDPDDDVLIRNQLVAFLHETGYPRIYATEKQGLLYSLAEQNNGFKGAEVSTSGNPLLAKIEEIEKGYIAPKIKSTGDLIEDGKKLSLFFYPELTEELLERLCKNYELNKKGFLSLAQEEAEKTKEFYQVVQDPETGVVWLAINPENVQSIRPIDNVTGNNIKVVGLAFEPICVEGENAPNFGRVHFITSD